MVNIVVLSMLVAQATGGEPIAAPAAVEERQELKQKVEQDLGAQAQPFPANGLNVGPPAGIPIGKLMLMPEIAVVVDGALGYTTLSDDQQAPSALVLPQHKVWPFLQEVELAFQATVDPYIRGDVFITFEKNGVSVEEAYLTTLSLPAGLQVKAGEIYTPFGRTSQLHRHQWNFIDQPLSMQRLVGLDGLSGFGGDLAWLAPLPWFAELHLAYQAASPGLGDVQQIAGTGRLIQYFEPVDAATIGVGLSWSFFQASLPEQWKNLAGADVYVKIRDPASRAHVLLQGEVYARQLGGQTFAQATWGGYGQAVWRVDPFWEVGARYDNAPAPVAYAAGTQQTWTALASYIPSEFFRIRLQPSLVALPGAPSGFQGIFSFEFTMGAHGAHPF
jgi:hypothetical protein